MAELAVWTAAITVAVWIGVAGIALAVLVTGDNEQPASVEQPTLQEEIAGWQWQPFVVNCKARAPRTPTPGGTWMEDIEAAFEDRRSQAELAVVHGVGVGPGFAWEFCLRSLDSHPEHMPVPLTITVTEPDGRTTEQVGFFGVGYQYGIDDDFTCRTYPTHFLGASTGTSGVYTAVFEVEGVDVGHASCTVVEP